MNKKENREVIQSYIITAAKYDFSVDEKRVLSHLVEMMQPLIEGKELVGKVEQDLWGTYHFILPTEYFFEEGANRQRIKQAIKSLNDKSFEYEDEDGWGICRLIEMPFLDKRGKVEIYLGKKLVDVFLNFNKGFSKYQLDISLSFKSVYSMRLYELISNQTRKLTFRISRLKEMWDITDKAYERNYNFIQRIIEVAKKELDEKSNWSFTYQPIKKGRSFELIEFTPIHFPERETAEVTRAEAMRQVNLSFFVSKEVKNYLIQTCAFSPREIKNNADTIKTYCDKFGTEARERITELWGRARGARNPKGYLIGTLKSEIENY